MLYAEDSISLKSRDKHGALTDSFLLDVATNSWEENNNHLILKIKSKQKLQI